MRKILFIIFILFLILPQFAGAVTQTFLTRGQMPGAANSFVTSSTSPSSDKLVLLFISNTTAGADTNPTVTGNGMTWVRVLASNDSDGNGALSVFRAMNTTSTPSTGAITVTFSGSQTRAAWTLSEFGNVDLTGTNGSGAVVQSSTLQIDTGSTSLIASTTLLAFASTNNAIYGQVYAENTGAGSTAIASFNGLTEITNQDLKSPASAIRMQDQWQATATTTSVWSITNINGAQTIVGALEIKHTTTTVASVVISKKRMVAFFDD